MLTRGILGRPSRLGITTSTAAAIAVLLLCLFFEYIVPNASALTPSMYLGVRNPNFRVVILYAATAGFHIFVCSLGAALLISRINAETSKPDIGPVVRGLAASASLIFGAVLTGCALKLNVVVHSYHATMLPLRSDPRFGFLFAKSDAVRPGFDFEPFALAPLSLILCGIVVAVVACFWISNRAIKFVHKHQDIKKAELQQLKRDISV